MNRNYPGLTLILPPAENKVETPVQEPGLLDNIQAAWDDFLDEVSAFTGLPRQYVPWILGGTMLLLLYFAAKK